MRASFLLVQEAALGLVACIAIAGWVGTTGNERANRLVQRREKAFIDTIVESNGH